MPTLKSIESDAKTWATGHLVAAALIALAAGVVIGALFF